MEPIAEESLPKATKLSKNPDISPVKLIVPRFTIGAGKITCCLLKLFTSPDNPSVVIYILLTCPNT